MLISISEVKADALDRRQIGGKAHSLARLAFAGVKIPGTYVLPSDVYTRFIDSTSLSQKIMVELSRKDFSEMRWEEMWDAALRIRNLFVNTPLPEDMRSELLLELSARFSNKPLVVRSSALWEDGSNASFAGLHESFVNVKGVTNILEQIKLVWASLWSDKALMYRAELGLDVEASAMAVVLQELVEGEKSGIVFSKSPDENPHSTIECVYGLNQGLVDGTVSPDRWIFSNVSNDLIQFHPASRDERLIKDSEGGTRIAKLSPDQMQTPPLTSDELHEVYRLGQFCEALFNSPQDVEWTYRLEELFTLQSRPITTLRNDPSDQRIWYRSLVRTFENLKELRRKISAELIPGMIEAADIPVEENLDQKRDTELADEILRRIEIVQKWTDIYWQYFIPFAHGIRLFGQFYNDSIKPEDPYEFMSLLGQTNMLSLERNEFLRNLALQRKKIQGSGLSHTSASSRDELKLAGISQQWQDWLSQFSEGESLSSSFSAFLEQYENARSLPAVSGKKSVDKMIHAFLEKFEGESRSHAEELLDLARYSYQLRDDDNIYLGQIQKHLDETIKIGVDRLSALGYKGSKDVKPEEIVRALRDPSHLPPPAPSKEFGKNHAFTLRARQLRGQPAGPGFATGSARVIMDFKDLVEFKAGEILVCDAIDPNMTFVVPLCSAIVERRGGMLIHGAIIAREYGLPCVTGVPEASTMIRTGDRISVDGYLGLITLG